MNTDPKTLSRIHRIEQMLEKMNIDLYPIVISDDAPSFPTSKSIWIDSGDMTLSFQYGYGNTAVWVSFGDLSIQEIIDLADVDPTDIGNGKVLVYNSITGKHEYKVISATLSTLNDVDDTDIGDDKILVYNSTSGKHEYQDKPSGGLDKTFQTLTEAPTITFDASISVNGSVTLTASRILGNITNAVAGEIHCVKVIQGGSGSYTLTYGNQYKFSGGILPILSATVNAVDLLFFLAVSTTEFHFINADFNVKAP